jgi:NAD-specific glutamate dehydrogenase
MVDALGSVLDALSQFAGPEPLAGSGAETLNRRLALFESFGITPALARQVAHFEFVTSLLDIAQLSTKSAKPLDLVANIYLTLDDQLRIGEIRRRILALPRDDRWDSLARASMRDDLAAEHLALTSAVLRTPTPNPHTHRPNHHLDHRPRSRNHPSASPRNRNRPNHHEPPRLASVVLRQLRTLA